MNAGVTIRHGRLLAIIAAVGLFLLVRLTAAALESDEWRGFLFSALHIAVVAGGIYFCLRSALK